MQTLKLFMTKHLRSRSTAWLLSLLLFFAMLFSALFIAAEADHSCTGEACPVCACIQTCEDCLTLLSCACAVMLTAAYHAVYRFFSAYINADFFRPFTPVLQRVRMNN